MGRDPLRRSATLILVLTATAVVLLDQATKAWARAALGVTADPGGTGRSLTVVDGLLSLTLARNTGAAFGLMRGGRWAFVAVAALVVVGVIVFWTTRRPSSRLLGLALGLIAGGALGNFIDRLVVGRVTDFIDVHVWPVFNIADASAVVGTGILVGWLLLAPTDDEAPDEGGDGASAGAPAEGDGPLGTGEER